jgi:hypothetical protein
MNSVLGKPCADVFLNRFFSLCTHKGVVAAYMVKYKCIDKMLFPSFKLVKHELGEYHYIVESFGLVIALRPQTPKHIRGGWSHTDTSEPIDGGVETLQP